MAKSLLEALLEEKLVNNEQAKSLQQESEATGKAVEDLILEKKLLGEEKLINIRSKISGIPVKKLVSGEKILPKILREIPEDTARFYRIVPLGKKDDVLEVGMVNPNDLRAREALKFITFKAKASIKIFLISQNDFHTILKDYRTLRGEVSEALKELEEELSGGVVSEKVGGEEKIALMAEEAPITKIVAVFLRHAVEGKASDIHIEPAKENLRVRFRHDGILYTSILLPLKVHPAVVARIKILSNLKIDETRVPQDGRFTARVSGKEVDFRVSTFPAVFGEKVVMRVLDPSASLVTLEQLGIEGKNLELITEAVKKPYGTVLITGPTGSGKSTTLSVILNLLNKESVNVVTLEDPVEYWVDGANQSQVNTDLGYTFASGLRHILRQDPDIIMVGEIRDEETADLATHAALTGHLVFSTLHTNDALGVIPRLIDMNIKPFLISASLNLAVAQRLVRKLCDECKEVIKPPPAIKKVIMEEIDSFPESIRKDIKVSTGLSVYQTKGCKSCAFKGTRGRIGIFEAMAMTSELEKVVLGELSEAALKEEARRQGMFTMRQDGILKALRGVVNIEEVLELTKS